MRRHFVPVVVICVPALLLAHSSGSTYAEGPADTVPPTSVDDSPVSTPPATTNPQSMQPPSVDETPRAPASIRSVTEKQIADAETAALEDSFIVEARRKFGLLTDSDTIKKAVAQKHSGLCLDASYGGTGNPTTLTQYGCYAGVPQRWRLVPAGTGDSDVYYVIRQDGPYCVHSSSPSSGAAVHQFACGYASNEQWRLVRTTLNYFSARPLSAPSSCIDVPGSSLSSGTATILWGCTGNSN